MEYQDKIVVVTGGAKGIGKRICDIFEKHQAKVCCIDIEENPYFIGDISDKNVLEEFAKKVISDYGRVDILINNAKPDTHGIDECTFEQFQQAMTVGVTAPFYLSKLFKPYFNENSSIINISSSRHKMSQPQTESYTASKGGITSLTHALASSLAGKVRVNSISPGWIDTLDSDFTKGDIIQHFSNRVGNPDDIVELILFLSSQKASFINGQDICVDGGMTKSMIYHNDNGWSLDV